jgi:hypothetical protein
LGWWLRWVRWVGAVGAVGGTRQKVGGTVREEEGKGEGGGGGAGVAGQGRVWPYQAGAAATVEAYNDVAGTQPPL